MKKLYYGILIAGITFSSAISVTNAQEVVSDKCYSIYTGEQIKYYLEQSDPNDLDTTCNNGTIFTDEKIKSDENLNKDIPIPYYFTSKLDVPTYKQEKYYYCGYAATKEVMQYLTGSSKSQSEYEQSINPGGSAIVYKIVNTLNGKIAAPKYSYTVGTNYNLSSFKKLVEDNIAKKRPIIMHSKSNSLPLYKKASKEVWHYYVINGYSISYNNNAEYIMYVDSNDKDYGDGNTLGEHIAPATDVFDTVHLSGRYIIHA